MQMNKRSVKAALCNLEANNVTNVFMVRMSSEDFVDAWINKTARRRLERLDVESLDLRTLVVDPPRAGLDEGTKALMSKFDRIVYISCNPDTLVENLEAVRESHTIRDFAVFDQFPYTHHIECGAYLVRNDKDRAQV
jgi:tRNA (uracil-5-)-methyltransferase